MSDLLFKSFDYPAPVDLVWEVLTSVTFMKQWYFPQLLKFEPVPGFHFKFTDHDQSYQKEWVVTRVKTGKLLAHSWAYKGYPGTSEVVFRLTPDGNNTHLSVEQSGIESFPDHPHFAVERFDAGWDNLLGSNLRRLLEADGERRTM